LGQDLTPGFKQTNHQEAHIIADQPTPFIRHYSDAEPYEQEEPGEAHFRMMMKKDELPGLQLGHVVLKGPIHKTPASHEQWHQAYFVYSGSGIIHLGDKTQTVKAPVVVSIPRNTRHSVEVPDGGELHYIFVNQWH